ncbi:hypothetical protein [Demequina zhanjiangensis]|uniref:Uncharacterized protein n=1 Tax=Demequina zhanjiangensis TaxID=3051659 RepID=A0ABT8FZ99_9MICO|nr:hypothetical protein [Demequina sp. SYSU T00b26]MDN4472143.1 hypothetical protein [Demequina sp. SYSU T00b26]
MRTLLVVLLVLFLAIAIVGFVVEALLWLAGIGILLFALTVVYWVVKAKMARRRSEAAEA